MYGTKIQIVLYQMFAIENPTKQPLRLIKVDDNKLSYV